MIKGLREELVRANGNKEVYEYSVKHLVGNDYEVPEIGLRFNAETGEIYDFKDRKIGETFKSGRREITYTLIVEEEKAEEVNTENPTTLVEEWKHEDGTVETKNTYTGRIWEKGSQKRLYLNNHNNGAYVDLNKGTFHPDRRKEHKVGEWMKNWGATVEYRYTLC